MFEPLCKQVQGQRRGKKLLGPQTWLSAEAGVTPPVTAQTSHLTSHRYSRGPKHAPSQRHTSDSRVLSSCSLVPGVHLRPWSSGTNLAAFCYFGQKFALPSDSVSLLFLSIVPSLIGTEVCLGVTSIPLTVSRCSFFHFLSLRVLENISWAGSIHTLSSTFSFFLKILFIYF